MKKKFRLYMTLVSIAAATIVLAYFDTNPFATLQQATQKADIPREVVLDQRAITHILDGDMRGGGHRFGTGKPCKSEFPEDWSDQKILGAVRTIAANDNLNWRKEDNGYFVAEQQKEELKIRVVLGPKQSRVITAYPINVERNPCPARDTNPANENTDP